MKWKLLYYNGSMFGLYPDSMGLCLGYIQILSKFLSVPAKVREALHAVLARGCLGDGEGWEVSLVSEWSSMLFGATMVPNIE